MAQLDASAQQRHKSPYVAVAWENDRVVLLQGIEDRTGAPDKDAGIP